MASMVEKTLLSASVYPLIEKLVRGKFLDIFRSFNLDVSILENLETVLRNLQDILIDSKEKLITKEWLNTLRFSIIEVDNLFDEINTEKLRLEVKSEYETLTLTSLVMNNISSRFNRFNEVINSKFQTLIQRLEFLCLRVFFLYCVDLLLEKIDYDGEEFEDFVPSKELDVELLENLKSTLVRLQLVLNHADEKQINNPSFEEWMDFKYAFFEIYNLFFNETSLVAEPKTLTATSQMLKNLSSGFKWFNGVINSKMQKLIQRLECLYLRRQQSDETSTSDDTQIVAAEVMKNLSSRFKRLNRKINSRLLIERLEGPSSREQQGELVVSNSNSVFHETPKSSVTFDESSIYGRDNDKNKLKDLLLASDCDSDIRFISIKGMGGIGKTTLAKLIYNDPEVNNKFELKVWADMSKDSDDIGDLSALEAILESITSQIINSDNLNTKRNDTSDVNTIYPKFLLVLDDLKDVNSVDWEYFMHIFGAREMGSRIIITTRVGMSMPYSLYVHHLRPLESEDCWSLVAKHAFGACNYKQQSHLEEIGRKIAKKCGGLPLIALSLGTLLRTKFSSNYWNYVLESDFWELKKYEVRTTLELSYDFLSDPLKRCFAYCSIFPKKSILEKKMVVQLWIAEGLIESPTTQESWEKVGEEYFDVLVSSSLIQRRFVDDVEANFEMHNLVHDLATLVSFPNCSRMDEHEPHEVHNLSYNRGLYDSFNKFDKLHRFKGIRTFLALPSQEQLPLCLLSDKVLHDFLPTMKHLRTLSLSNYRSITEVPNSIGNLLYLRYLNLSHSKIERLPSETCKLCNLQFLLLSSCKRLTELPEEMGKLVNLRLLDVSDTALTEMPVQLVQLKNLNTLSNFVVSEHHGGLKVQDLREFPHLHGKLFISQLQNVNDPYDASLVNMKMKEKIDELTLEWDCGSTVLDSQIQIVVLEHL